MSLLASTLPTNDGYVAAAYIVFFALVLVYVAIMAVRLGRVERKLRDMQGERADEAHDAMSADGRRWAGADAAEAQRAEAGEREREVI